MTRKPFCCALACWLVTWAAVRADDLFLPGLTQVQAPPERQTPPRADQMAAVPLPPPPGEEGEAPERTNPHMIGDFPGLFVLRTFFVPATQTVFTTQAVTQTQQVNVVFRDQDGQLHNVRVPVTTTVQVPVQQQRIVEAPVSLRVAFPFRGEFNVAEGESPRPEDRVFFHYDYYSSVTGPGTSSGLPRLDTTTTTINGRPATVTTLIPGVPPPSLDLHREVVGFEKTFLGGDASVELRAPVVEQVGADAIGGSDFGDVTVVLKYAFLNDRVTGDVLAAGFAVTLPTGPGLPLQGGGDLHSTLLQPWVGYLWNFDRFYVEGFSSLVVPTDARDVTLLFNDVGVGYALYRAAGDRLISAVVPTVEAHVTTPLNHRSDTGLVTVPDLVVLTAGSHFDIGRSATLSVGVAAPVTGPRAFDVEALVQFNYRF
jgi:hypothetical protein